MHQFVDADNFEKVRDADSSKEAWDVQEKSFGGAKKVKKARLQTHKRMYELIQIEATKIVVDFFTRVTKLVNKSRCMEKS